MADREDGNGDGDIIQDGDSSDVQEKHIKPVRLSLHLIVKRHLSVETTEWPQEKIIEELNKIRRVRLDRENIGDVDSLELLSADVTHLYLQSNKISRIQNLECLPNLQVLVMSNNQISKIRGIRHLQKLVFLDLSDNCINETDEDEIIEIPKSLIILNLKGNPCCKEPNHRFTIIKVLPKLKQLDGSEVTVKEKVDAGVLNELSDDDEEDDDDDEESDNDEERNEVRPGGNDLDGARAESTEDVSQSGGLQHMAYKQLPKIQASIQDFATEMLIRSQNRLEDCVSEHKRHVQEITNARIKSKIMPIPQISKPHQLNS